eukprot:351570-Chlamydomonas_euryale.AAC.4
MQDAAVRFWCGCLGERVAESQTRCARRLCAWARDSRSVPVGMGCRRWTGRFLESGVPCSSVQQIDNQVCHAVLCDRLIKPGVPCGSVRQIDRIRCSMRLCDRLIESGVPGGSVRPDSMPFHSGAGCRLQTKNCRGAALAAGTVCIRTEGADACMHKSLVHEVSRTGAWMDG